MKKFAQEAKRYGILYCAIRDPKRSKDGMVDIMVKEEDFFEELVSFWVVYIEDLVHL